jgi:hypothetical protein
VFAFGGLYPSALPIPALASVLLAIAYRPALLSSAPTPRLDLSMFVVLATAALQILPLPPRIVALVSPSAETVRRTLSLVDARGALPLSIDARSSFAALLLVAGVWLVFFTARQMFGRSGVRTTTRMIAVIGLVVSAVALAQDATAHGLMYWRWRPPQEGPAPFGPFVNRNHFATWGMMAVPLCIGYLMAHTAAHHGARPAATWQRKVVTAIDPRAWLLTAAVTLLIVAIAASLSRSGLVGLAAALFCGALLARRRGRASGATGFPSGARSAVAITGRSGKRSAAAPRREMAAGKATGVLMALGVLAVLAVLTQVGPAAIAGRFGTSGGAMADRLTIWHDTLSVLRDFWATGTGVGTFLTSMGVYQHSRPGVIFNQAHNHYLQVAAEGGLLVGIPAALALWTLARAGWEALSTDRSGMYWIRAGAASGLCGAAVQSVWETGLTVPANALLAAVLAAILIHQPIVPGARIR